LTHPKSYLHAITKFSNGLTKLLLHDPDMKIPIYNSIYSSNAKPIKTYSLDLKILNNLELREVDTKKFPLVKLLRKLPNNSSLFETVLITINDYLVYKFLEKKINFKELINLINRISNFKEFQKFKKIKPKSIDDIYELRDYVSLKLDSLGI
jgi:1-deoxy-D-xylulose-5-phosphate reductoisomerase